MATYGLEPPERRSRADARRSRAAILDAAMQVLNDDPDASMEAIGAAAGVTRQTVYAHHLSRQDLVDAVVQRLTEVTIAEMDAADLRSGPAAEALLRLLDVGRRLAERYPGLVRVAAVPVSAEVDRQRHEPIVDRLREVIARGQATGDFTATEPTDWLIAATLALGHASGADVAAGRMPAEHVAVALRSAVLRVVGAQARLAGG